MRNPLVVVGLALVAACSSGSKSTKQPKGGGAAGSRPAPRPAPTLRDDQLCPTVVAQLKAEVKDVDAEVVEVVMRHCQGWPVSVQRCLATSKAQKQRECMNGLDPAKRQAFGTELGAVLEGPPECDALAPDSTDAWLALPAAATDAAAAANRTAIRRALETACKDNQWPVAARKCIGRTPATPRTCLDKLDPEIGARLDTELKLRGELFTRAAAFKDGDAKIKCEKVVAAHYGDARWKGKLAGTKAADKKKLVKGSAAALLKACKTDKWSAYARGCVIAAKGDAERGWCLDEKDWGYPAASVGAAPATARPGGTGIAECDAYIAIVERYVVCDKIPQASRDAVRQGLDQMKAGWNPGMPDDAKKAAADACRAGTDAVKQGATAIGCPL